jgi:iron complex outermembrane receptor protein
MQFCFSGGILMKKPYSRLLALSTLFLGVGAAVAQPVDDSSGAANASSDTSGSMLETVTVQARRRDEDLQRVPIAVTALTAADIKQQDLSDAYRLARTIPSYNLCCKQGTTAYGWVRGIQGIVYYFADAPFSAGGFGTTFDLENVQMLKGPQGTLFGLASNGGALLYSPKRPTAEADSYAEVTAGNYNRLSVEGAINLPLLGDRVLVRLAAKKFDRDGFIYNLQDGQHYDDQHYYDVRGSMIVKITDDIENYSVFNYYDFHQAPSSLGPLTAVRPGGPASVKYGPALDAALLRQQQLGIYTREGYSVIDNGVQPYARTRQINAVNTTTLKFSDSFSVKNIFAMQSATNFSLIDQDETLFTIEDVGQPDDTFGKPSKQWSDEVQLSGELLEGSLSYQAGGYYSESHNDPVMDFSMTLDSRSAARSYNWARTHAFYAQGTYKFLDSLPGLSLTAGYRYTWDWRRQLNQGFNAATLVQTRNAPGEGEWQAGSYTFSAQYEFSPETMVYVSNGKGYSSGGLSVTAPPQFRSYDPESLNNFEAGLKTTYNIGSWEFRTNLAAYYGLYDDVVVQVSRSVQVDPPPAPMVSQIVLENAAKAHISGVELELQVAPMQGMRLGAFMAYNDFQFDTWSSTNPATGLPQDLTSTKIQYTPYWKFGLSGTVPIPLPTDALGQLSLTANYTYAGTVYNTLLPAEAIIKNIHTQPPLRNLDMSIDWNNVFGKPELKIQAFATNVLENEIAYGLRATYESLGYYTVLPADPRQYGIRLRYDF